MKQKTGGQIDVLNVAGGDITIRFDKNDVREQIRAGRIIGDMLNRGYALLIEVEGPDGKKYQRARGFDPETSEYIIADFDPVIAELADREPRVQARHLSAGVGDGGPGVGGADNGEVVAEAEAELAGGESNGGKQAEDTKKVRKGSGKREARSRRVGMAGTKAVAVARSAGG
jgi:hypothetical protein